AAVYYSFPDNPRPPWWRRGSSVLAVVGLHLGGLVFAFGVSMQAPVPQNQPALEMRVIEASPLPVRVAVQPAPPANRPLASRAARPVPVPPVVKTPPAKALAAANVGQTPTLTAVERPATPADTSMTNDATPAPTAAPMPQAASAAASAGHPPPLQPARFDADYLHNPVPHYPEAARRLGQEGRVLLRVRVSAQGTPLAIDIRQSSGFPRLDEAARSAVAHWRFVPARRGDEAVESSVLVPLQFRLDD
ncbi:MAG TPA: TonB family protein, partial [Accumulibacter sp.]|nr:TonB family protein [Accumulibacter sp.]